MQVLCIDDDWTRKPQLSSYPEKGQVYTVQNKYRDHNGKEFYILVEFPPYDPYPETKVEVWAMRCFKELGGPPKDNTPPVEGSHNPHHSGNLVPQNH